MNQEQLFRDFGFDIYLEASFLTLNESIQEMLFKLYPSFDFHHKKLILLGSSGDQVWKRIKDEEKYKKSKHPLDNYTLDCIHFSFPEITTSNILYPSQSSIHFPILSTAESLGFSHPSPLGIHITQKFGLWFSFRAIFVTEITSNVEGLSNLISMENSISPCNNCISKPCTQESDFWNSRSACPIKSDLRYEQNFIDYLKETLSLVKKS